MACTFFQKIYKVLEMYGIPTRMLDRRRLEMMDEYYNHRVSFTDIISKCAYIRTDVPFLANALLRVLHKHTELTQLFSKEYYEETDPNDNCSDKSRPQTRHKKIKQYLDLNVMSVGCGPGTDMLALIRYIHKFGDFEDKILRLVLTDDEPSWEAVTDKFEQVIRQAQDQMHQNGSTNGNGNGNQDGNGGALTTKIKFTKKFVHWKILDRNLGDLPRGISAKLEITHLFIFNLFFTTVVQTKDFKKYAMAAFNIKRMFDAAMRGAFFLFIDVNRSDALHIRKKGLQLAGFRSRTTLKIGQGSSLFWLPREEDKGDLHEYFSVDCQPKLGRDTQLDFVVYQKL